MKKILYLSLAIVVYAVYAEEISPPEQPAEVQQSPDVTPAIVGPPVAKVPPVTLDTLLHSKSLLEPMQELVNETDKQLQIQFPENVKNTQLVMELQDKLIALGLPSERIRLSPDEDQNGEFLFEIVELSPYQEPEQAIELEVETDIEPESETQSEQEQE